MKRLLSLAYRPKAYLYWLGVILVIGVAAGASYAFPEFVVWVAWLNCLLFWRVAHSREQWQRATEASRDRWRGFAGKMERARDDAERREALLVAQIQRLRGEIEEVSR